MNFVSFTLTDGSELQVNSDRINYIKLTDGSSKAVAELNVDGMIFGVTNNLSDVNSVLPSSAVISTVRASIP